MRRSAAMAAVLLVAAGLSGCAPGSSNSAVVVYAAASLRPTFTAIADRFQQQNPGAAVDLNFGGAADLATQLIEGAGADVFASADTAQMRRVTDAGLTVGDPVTFASNTLVIVTAPGNPKHIDAFADLARPGVAVVVSPPPMPCGVATRRVEDLTGVHLDPVSEEPDVEDVLNKVVTGQADAGLVNITDAIAAGDKVDTVTFPAAAEAVTHYPIAVLRDSTRDELARRFVEMVTDGDGQEILREAGFARASASGRSPR
ncbi:molybdate ABC transporter substrate-binding protein [Mycolicibacillus trivialis]